MIRFLFILLAIYVFAKLFQMIVLPLFRGYASGEAARAPKKKKYRGEIVEANFEDVSAHNNEKKENAGEKKSE